MQLQTLARGHRHGNRVRITHGDARKHLKEILQRQDWASTRGVLFLDPYGLQCTWAMVEQIARTKLDVFFLVSLAGLSRQAATSEAAVDSVKAASLDRFLGTDAWRCALYAPPATHDLFDDHPGEQTRRGGTEAIVRFMHERLQEVFAHVVEPVVLRTSRNAALFALFFSVSNRAPAAKALAGRVARDVLSKLR